MYLAPSAYEACFTSLAHGDKEIEATLDAAEHAFATIAAEAKA
ncbi:glutamate-1-semialdehyde aminotransferase [Photobacterium aphoticum]|uniref:Glutamate-1-semialdehyde aminotransferase n=1 Tax=Photobacterium aphoticum TaxID=754436 RepID=A0A090REA8_9GAMM|nr:glutamate-1-semialdehyde aminotransferase [Photobacterium aphoticum]